MLPFKKILVPIDYSLPCQAAMPYVRDMARHFSAELTLVHSYGPEALAFSDLPIADPGLPEEVRGIQEHRLRDFARETFPDQRVETIVALGEAGSVVHKIVQERGTDLVMLATHGHGPVRRLLLGSVAAKVLHDVSAAVWTGTALADHVPGIPYKSVLCALDDSEETESTLRAAAAFANDYHAQLWLVRAVETPPTSFEIDFSPYRKDLMDAADFKLRELKGKLGITAPHTVIDGAVADGVQQEALRRKADLVITGRGHAQGGLSRIWSHLYGIVRESPCPVLSI